MSFCEGTCSMPAVSIIAQGVKRTFVIECTDGMVAYIYTCRICFLLPRHQITKHCSCAHAAASFQSIAEHYEHHVK